jgi:hypothetical protein
MSMLQPQARIRGAVNVDLVVARAKIADATSLDEVVNFLSLAETFAALNEREALGAALALGRPLA